MFPSVEDLIRLLLVHPTSSCESERTFSALRRLKTWLRATMSCERQNSLCVASVHNDKIDEIDNTELMKVLVLRNSWRKKVLGDIKLARHRL